MCGGKRDKGSTKRERDEHDEVVSGDSGKKTCLAEESSGEGREDTVMEGSEIGAKARGSRDDLVVNVSTWLSRCQ